MNLVDGVIEWYPVVSQEQARPQLCLSTHVGVLVAVAFKVGTSTVTFADVA